MAPVAWRWWETEANRLPRWSLHSQLPENESLSQIQSTKYALYLQLGGEHTSLGPKIHYGTKHPVWPSCEECGVGTSVSKPVVCMHACMTVTDSWKCFEGCATAYLDVLVLQIVYKCLNHPCMATNPPSTGSLRQSAALLIIPGASGKAGVSKKP